jgi:uncharacterized protein (UPF0276 family)
VQTRLRRHILLENPSTYFEFEASSFTEPHFIHEIVERTGCGLLLDVNNVHVSCHNNQRDPLAYLDALPCMPWANCIWPDMHFIVIPMATRS